MLELMNVSKKFDAQYAVKNMNMYIEQGEIVGLLGPNGAGKSTTISMMSSLIEPTSGDVLLHQQSVLKNPKPLRRISGIVPQELALYGDLTAKENLQFFGRLYNLTSKELEKKIKEVLHQVGLYERQHDLVRNYSGGMRRRLNIGIALLHNPEFIIMDEPTVGIDPQSRKYILEIVKQFNEEYGMTVVYTSHYMEEVEFLCDRIYIMDRGDLIASGTKEEIKQIISTEHTILIEVEMMKDKFIHYLEEEARIKNVHTVDNTITALVHQEIHDVQTTLQHAEEAQVQLKSVENDKLTLEDVCLHLTARTLRDEQVDSVMIWQVIKRQAVAFTRNRQHLML